MAPPRPSRRHFPPGWPLDIGRARIGLLGGSFNPPHAGHIHISHLALARLGLDEVWWLVSPQNPLKSPMATGGVEYRLRQAKKITASARFIRVLAPEADLGTRATIDLARWLRQRYARGHFVWLMGADNLASFHLWRDWRRIAEYLPIAVIDRPGYRHVAMASRAGQVLAPWRWPQSAAAGLVYARPPAWTFLQGPLSPASSTAIRAIDLNSGERPDAAEHRSHIE